MINKNLKSNVIPKGVTSIKNQAFFGCSSLTSIVIPKGVTSIGDSAFNRCSSLTSIEIPSSVTSIGDKAFYGCSSLTSIVIPKGVTSIGDFAFDECSSLTSIEIPSSVTSIGEYAFSNCSSLTSIVIPNSVISIGKNAFNRCSSITSIIVHENNKVYDSRNNCNAIVETSTNSLIQGCNNTVIPNTIISIEEFAFEGCQSLTNIVIPDSVANISENAFKNCRGLTNIIVDENNTVYDSRDNCNAIIETSSNTLIVFSKNTVIPLSVMSIGEDAFSVAGYGDFLDKVIIPQGVQTINCWFDGVQDIIIYNPNVKFTRPIGNVKKITFIRPFEENLDFIKYLLFILDFSNEKTKVIFADEITGDVTNSYTLSEIKKMNKKFKEIKKELEIKKNNESINFSYNYIINQIDDKTFEIVDKKKSIKVNVFKSFQDFEFGYVALLYALKRKKDGTFLSGRISSGKEDDFYDFCSRGNDYEKWPGYIDFDSLDEMQNYLDKCIKRTNKKTIYISMSAESFECIEITKLKFKNIEEIVNGNSYWQGFYLANSKIYAVHVHRE